MKNKALLFLVLSFSFTSPSSAMPKGNLAPDFSLRSSSGEVVKLSSFQGKVIYLDFWASWCPPCKLSFPWLNQLDEKYRNKGLVVLGINLDKNPHDAEKFIQLMEPKFQILLDSQGLTPPQYGVPGMPSSYVIGRDGAILSVHSGFKDSIVKEVEEQIVKALETK